MEFASFYEINLNVLKSYRVFCHNNQIFFPFLVFAFQPHLVPLADYFTYNHKFFINIKELFRILIFFIFLFIGSNLSLVLHFTQ